MGATHIGWLADPHLGMAGYRWAQYASTVVGGVAVAIWLFHWWRTAPPRNAAEQRPPAGRRLVATAWTAIGLATVAGAALALTEEVSLRRTVFLAVTNAGGAGLTTVIVLAAGYAVLTRRDRPAPR
ncbi:hypothetical protein Prubr_51750 [Polymorphospora rubra]|uniref:Uncharacterized protein n=1 Tax=Polymorphospora rubra TaxID=338584 RepID=A0A810N6P6_9ACTN|nr:DUF4184 family protein [Polymorphospora rubra]BCJ68154.1 hypothetical protein Prubr_51750 [Polymorphospora rubra]